MKEKQRLRWKETRKKGPIHFILVKGILFWALPMFILMTFIANEVALDDYPKITISAIIWTLGGLSFGALLWWWSEREYAKHQE